MEDFLSDNDKNYEVQLTTSKKEPRIPNEGHLTIDVYQTDDDVVVRSAIAGASRDNIDIAVTQDMITIKGRREPEDRIKPSDYFHRRFIGAIFPGLLFCRKILMRKAPEPIIRMVF
jgi:HSP20 family molecular chaperone IbpA